MRFGSVFLITIAIVFGSQEAVADGAREFGPYVGFGFSRTLARVQQPGVETSLAGWGNSAEAGLDVPFSSKLGLTIAVEIGETDLRNTYKAADYLDQTTIKSKGLRAGFFYRNLTVGYGSRNVTLDVKAVSSTTGSSAAHLEGAGSYGFASFSIDHKDLMRGSLELQANNSELNSFSYSDYTIGLKAYILVHGLLD